MLKYISDNEDQLDNSINLGGLLTKAREKLELSQKDIASRLNLKEEIIAALDANSFDDLPAPTYVRGYIRSYARAVNLDADNIIKIYQGSADAPPEILPDVKPKVQASSKDTPVKAMTYLITFTLMILIIAWWQGKNIVDTDLFLNKVKTSEGGEYPGGFTYTYDIVTHPEILTVAKIEDTEHMSENMEVTVSPDILELPETSNPESNKPGSSDQLSIDDFSNLNAQTNPNTLKLELTAESWIEVYDALGKKLYIGLAKPGKIISLTGTLPLSVKIGNASAVSVNFNGKAFDTNKHTKAGVARFLLE